MRALSRVPCSRPLHPGRGACGRSSAERPPGTDPRLSSVSQPGLGESQQHLLSRPSGTGGKRSADSHTPAPQGEAPWLPGVLPSPSSQFCSSAQRQQSCVCFPPRRVALKHASSRNLELTTVSLLGDLSCAPLFQCLETTFSNVLSGLYGNRENPALAALAVCL